LLWTPENQEVKYSQYGGRTLASSYLSSKEDNGKKGLPASDPRNGLSRNLRYKRNLKRELVNNFTQQLNQQLPYCNIRYAF
jgi:hypothetical protein